MISRRITSALLLLALGLAGCAGTVVPPPAEGPLAPVPMGGEPVTTVPDTGGESQGPAAESSAVETPEQALAVPLPPVSENRAVIALLDRAHQDRAAGRPDVAGASLERALRIEPRNPWLWHEFARLRLTQGQYAQAVSFAQKSNSVSRRDRVLQAKNWRLIADARVGQGDQTGARKALARAEAIEKQDR